ncbi:MAG: tRNA lysidine(34) synthetase TilS [Flavobacteriaceae bacterium]|nr:MAG: tRNA lysidine(34) synthetase TilS [Flavobacteriaceae bacterium]
MLEKLRIHIQQNLPFLNDKKLLLAVSGGIDSMILVDTFHKLGLDIGIAHCNFKLRNKSSDKDERFVIDTAARLNIPMFHISFETKTYAAKHQVSIQMAARELRYEWFRKISSENHYDYLLTAHHRDDVIETFLINFSRGTGLDGLTGIPTVNNEIVRPLLPFSRSHINVYAAKNKLTWREDKSNADTKYLRNKIRHNVVPVFKELNPSFSSSFSQTICNLNESKTFITQQIERLKKAIVSYQDNSIIIDIEALKAQGSEKFILREILKEYQFTQWDDVHNLLTAQSGKFIISATHRLLKNRNELILSEITKEDSTNFKIENDTKKIKKPLHLKFKKITEEKLHKLQNNPKSALDKIHIDLDNITFPLTLRKWQQGDVFYPFGMQGKKKISKFFKDEKMSVLEKENTWVLCTKDRIIWVVGRRMDDRFKIKKSTTNGLKITLKTGKKESQSI